MSGALNWRKLEGVPSSQELQQGFRLGDWHVLPNRGVLRRDSEELHPEPLVFKVLLALARRDGDLVTRDELIDEIWGGRPIGDEPINRCLSQLRGHLGDKQRPHRYIETLTKRGYRLLRPVELLEDAAAKTPEAPRRPTARQFRIGVLAVAIVAAVLVGAYVRILPPGDAIQSIGVLPFRILSDDSTYEYLAHGFKNELVHTLSKIPDVAVKHGRVNYPDREISEIAGILGVNYVMSGELQRAGDSLKVTYRLERGDDGATVSFGEVRGQVGDEFRMQGELAVLVRNDLVGSSPQQLISANRNPASAAFDRYMQGLHAFERRGRGSLDNLDKAIALFEESIAIDPGFGPAYLSLATAYALLPDYRQAPLSASHERALQLAERAARVDAHLYGASQAIVGFVHHKQRRWLQAEEAYLRATKAEIVDSNAFNWYSLMLGRVGRLQASLDQVLAAHRMDPTSAVINSRVGIVYNWLGESGKAAKYFAAAENYDASNEVHLLGKSLLLIREERYDDAAQVTRAAVRLAGGNIEWIAPLFAALDNPDARPEALAALDAGFTDPRLDQRVHIVARVLLDDIEGAMKVAMMLTEEGQIAELDLLFMPELRPLRDHPGFMELMERLGVTGYWQARGCEWRNDRVNCPSSR